MLQKVSDMKFMISSIFWGYVQKFFNWATWDGEYGDNNNESDSAGYVQWIDWHRGQIFEILWWRLHHQNQLQVRKWIELRWKKVVFAPVILCFTLQNHLHCYSSFMPEYQHLRSISLMHSTRQDTECRCLWTKCMYKGRLKRL